jgi:putative oxidoreductase
MHRVALVIRLLLGLVFLVFGLNGFFHFLPQPNMPQRAIDFFSALGNTGYMPQLIFTTQIVGGALLLINCFVPLALALLAPVIVNIILFHIYLAPSGLPIAIVVLVLELYLAFAYRKSYRSMLAFRTKPD